MATIYEPIRPDGTLTREEALANTEVVYPKREEPLSNEALNKIRTEAQVKPQHQAHSATAARLREERQAREQRVLDALRAASIAKGGILTPAERLTVIEGLK
jgi:hypothetical protein